MHRIEADDLIAQRPLAQRIDFPSDRPVMSTLAGERPSGFRGRGMEFEEHRVYQPGDEARTIDWRVTARSGTPHVRLYREERERQVLLAVDLRAPMWFGTRRCYKAVHAARAAAVLAWSAMANGERVGGMRFGAECREARPAGGRRGALRLIHLLCGGAAPAADAAPQPDALADALRRLERAARAGGIVAIFSDFRGCERLELDLLRRLTRRAELIAGFVHDPLEESLPPPDVYPVADPAGDARVLVDTRPAARRAQWHEAFVRRRDAVRAALRGSGAHWLELGTAQPAHEVLSAAFGTRRHAA